MTKSLFLKKLKSHISSLSIIDQNQYIDYYDEMIEDYIEDGVPEIDAVSKVGDPLDIARNIIEQVGSEPITVKTMSVPLKILIGTLLVVGFPLWGSILLAAVLLILSVYIIIWCLPFVTGVFGIFGFAASIASVLFSIFAFGDAFYIGLTQLGLGCVFLGISILSCLVTFKIGKFFIKVTASFTTKIFSIFKRKEIIA